MNLPLTARPGKRRIDSLAGRAIVSAAWDRPRLAHFTGSVPMKTPLVSAAKRPAKSLASGLLPCDVEITPPRTVGLVGSAMKLVVVVVVPVVDWSVDPVDVWPVVVDVFPEDVDVVVVTEVGNGGVAKLGLIAPGRMLSSMVGSIAVL